LKLKKPTESFSRQQLILALGSTSLAILLWLFVTSGNIYTMTFEMPIEARNLSKQKAHREEVPQIASVRLKGRGLDLFKASILKRFSEFKLVLDLEGISNEYEFILSDYFEKYPQKVVIPDAYNLLFIEVAHPNRIKISLDDYSVKFVPIIPNVFISMMPGFIQVGDISMTPSAVEVAGPKDKLENVESIETVLDSIINANMDKRGSIQLKSLGRLVEYSQKTVFYSLDVQQISERIIADIPVRILNKPINIRVFPSPQTVSLTIVGGVDRIANLSNKDIAIMIDFNQWSMDKQFYEPTVQLPKDILEWRDLSPRSLELGVARESN
jgi:YbbR domain-containing protein